MLDRFGIAARQPQRLRLIDAVIQSGSGLYRRLFRIRLGVGLGGLGVGIEPSCLGGDGDDAAAQHKQGSQRSSTDWGNNHGGSLQRNAAQTVPAPQSTKA